MKKRIRKGTGIKILRNLDTQSCSIDGLIGKIIKKEKDGTFWVLVTKNKMGAPFHINRSDFRIIRKSKRKQRKI